MSKEYLGDSVYVDCMELEDAIVLTTEDGIAVSSSIVLERDVINALLKYITNVYSKQKEANV